METVYAKNEYVEKENKKLMAEIKSSLSTCSPLDILCSEEHGVWGIWLHVGNDSFLVNPLELLNSIYMDDVFYMLEKHPNEDGEYKTIEIHRDRYCYNWKSSILPKPLYFNFEEYRNKIKSCVKTLQDAMSAEKKLAYVTDFDSDAIGNAVEQLELTATQPGYYRITTDDIKVETFHFSTLKDKYSEYYLIGIGDRQYSTWLTHWDNDFDRIRYQFESLYYNKESRIELSFDMSDTVLIIKKVSVLDKVDASNGGYGFSYKDYALVEIQPNVFVHEPILKGYCELKETIRTLYEGLLTHALAHPAKEHYDDEPIQLEAYNKLKSPLIEKLLTESKKERNAPDERQIHVKRILKLYPDYDEVIIDSEGKHIDVDESGLIDEIYDKNGDPIRMPELVELQNMINPIMVESECGNEMEFDWENFHKKGIEIVQELRRRLSTDFDIWYCKPIEDKYSKIPKLQLIM